MKKITAICFALIMSANMFATGKLDLKDITSGVFAAKNVTGINPLPGSNQYATISEDGKRIIRYAYKTGKPTATLFDADNTSGERIDRVEGYDISHDGKRLLIRTNVKPIYRRSYTAEFYVYDIATRHLQKLSTGGAQQVPVFSPDNKHVAFVRENNIFCTDGTNEIQLTTDGKFNEIINGIPDWVNEEEFSFNRAYTFNADGSTLSWIRYDESNVKTYSLQLFKGLSPEHEEFAVYPGEYSYKYPKAGEDNARLSLWSYDMAKGTTIQLNVPIDSDGYYPRIVPTERPDRIIVYTMNRHQDVLKLYAVNPHTGESRVLLQEKVDKYVKEEAMEGIIVAKKHILVPSDRDGHMHLYLYDADGNLLRQVEKGDYDVTTVYGFDEPTGDVYFQAAVPTPHDRQVMVAHADGSIEVLTDGQGENRASFSGDWRYFVNVWSDYDHPYVYTCRNRKGKVIKVLEDNAELITKTTQAGWTRKEAFTFTTSEGVTLDGWMVKPADFDSTRRYPVILFQYSGPGNQQVMNSWSTGSMGQGGAFDMYLAQEGFIVVCVDGRGTGGRGAEFEKCIYLHLGLLEARDQVETALYMSSLPYVDKDRIGIWGWSYGGYNTLMSMSEGRPVFKAGVAVAPPTSYRYYDTIYTERYMRTPKENPEGYADNAMTRASKLHGALLICHGVTDDNVHPQNTFEYAEALVQADKDFKENYYTNRNHSIFGGNTRNHLLRQIATWFKQNL